MRLEATVAVLGAGKLGEAFLRGVLDSGVLRASDIRASVRSPGRAQQLSDRYAVEVFAADNRQALRGASVVILAVKPDAVSPVLAEIAPSLGPAHTLISLAAAVPLDLLERACRAGLSGADADLSGHDESRPGPQRGRDRDLRELCRR